MSVTNSENTASEYWTIGRGIAVRNGLFSATFIFCFRLLTQLTTVQVDLPRMSTADFQRRISYIARRPKDSYDVSSRLLFR